MRFCNSVVVYLFVTILRAVVIPSCVEAENENFPTEKKSFVLLIFFLLSKSYRISSYVNVSVYKTMLLHLFIACQEYFFNYLNVSFYNIIPNLFINHEANM